MTSVSWEFNNVVQPSKVLGVFFVLLLEYVRYTFEHMSLYMPSNCLNNLVYNIFFFSFDMTSAKGVVVSLMAAHCFLYIYFVQFFIFSFVILNAVEPSIYTIYIYIVSQQAAVSSNIILGNNNL